MNKAVYMFPNSDLLVFDQLRTALQDNKLSGNYSERIIAILSKHAMVLSDEQILDFLRELLSKTRSIPIDDARETIMNRIGCANVNTAAANATAGTAMSRDAMNEGTVPTNEGTVPMNEGTIPRSESTISMNEGTVSTVPRAAVATAADAVTPTTYWLLTFFHCLIHLPPRFYNQNIDLTALILVKCYEGLSIGGEANSGLRILRPDLERYVTALHEMVTPDNKERLANEISSARVPYSEAHDSQRLMHYIQH
jgi:hypothetical protein